MAKGESKVPRVMGMFLSRPFSNHFGTYLTKNSRNPCIFQIFVVQVVYLIFFNMSSASTPNWAMADNFCPMSLSE